MPLLEVCAGCSVMRCFAGKVSRRVGVGLCVMRVWPRKHTMLGFLQYFPREVRSDYKNFFLSANLADLPFAKCFQISASAFNAFAVPVCSHSQPQPLVFGLFFLTAHPCLSSLLWLNFFSELSAIQMLGPAAGSCW